MIPFFNRGVKMSLTNLYKRTLALELASRVNSLTEIGTDKRIATFSLTDMVYVYDKISPYEYQDLEKFIKKLINKEPLMKIGTDKKGTLEEDDFIYYK